MGVLGEFRAALREDRISKRRRPLEADYAGRLHGGRLDDLGLLSAAQIERLDKPRPGDGRASQRGEHVRDRPLTGARRVWSIYGAKRAQPVATGRKWKAAENRSVTPIGNQWQPTATVSQRMVRRGSTVRVRQRALKKRRTFGTCRSDRVAGLAAGGGYGAVYGALGVQNAAAGARRASSQALDTAVS